MYLLPRVLRSFAMASLDSSADANLTYPLPVGLPPLEMVMRTLRESTDHCSEHRQHALGRHHALVWAKRAPTADNMCLSSLTVSATGAMLAREDSCLTCAMVQQQNTKPRAVWKFDTHCRMHGAIMWVSWVDAGVCGYRHAIRLPRSTCQMLMTELEGSHC